MNSIKKYEKNFKDLVVLGRSAPEEISDGRVSNCLASWSLSENRFVRIYPIKMNVLVKRWDIISVPTGHDESHDDRVESYKIIGSKTEWNQLQNKIKKVGRLNRRSRRKLLSKIPRKCTEVLNYEKRSLGLIKPTKMESYIEDNEIEKDKISTHNYPYLLRIKYWHQNCKLKQGYHKQKCINWGVYRYWDKNPDNPQGVIDALHLHDNKWDRYFLVGNLFHYKTSFVIIAVLNFKKTKNSSQSFFR